MKIEEPIVQLILAEIQKAVTEKRTCHVTMKNTGVSMLSYQDKIGNKQRLELYHGTESLNNNALILSIMDARLDSPNGVIICDWENVARVNISQDYNRVNIQLGDININFLT